MADPYEAARTADKRRRESLRVASLQAIRQIALGHDDPQRLAMDVLREFGEGTDNGH
jgi:hypothetical protein